MRRLLLHLPALLLLAFAAFAVWRVPLRSSVELEYLGPHSNIYHKEFAEVDWNAERRVDAAAGHAKRPAARIFKRHASLPCAVPEGAGRILLILSSSTKPVTLERVTVRCGACDTLSIPASALLSDAEFESVERAAETDGGALELVPSEQGRPSCVLSAALSTRIRDAMLDGAPTRRLLLLFAALFALALDALVLRCAAMRAPPESRRAGIAARSVFLATGLVLLLAGVQLFGIAAFSEVRGHPDEDVTRLAIGYYESHWGLPDYDSPAFRKTFSNYGTSRLHERTPYYFIAGKASRTARALFGVSCPCRAFNLLLFAAFVALFIWKGPRHPWLAVPLLATPQLWYLFSYATSDAWDFSLAFGIVAILLSDHGLFGAAREPGRFAPVAAGAMAGMLLLGKPNYWIAFPIAAALFVARVFAAPRGGRIDEAMRLFRRWVLPMACAALAVVALRILAELAFYHGHRSSAFNAVASGRNDHYYTSGRNLVARGRTFHNVMVTRFLGGSWKSFIGTYGWMSLFPSESFSRFFGWALGIAVGALSFSAVRRDRRCGICATILLLGCACAVVAASGWNSWRNDFQAQGRYLLPALLGLLPLAGCCRDRAVAPWALLAALGFAGLAGMYCFGFSQLVGLP